jgi:hypothetical protein
MADKDAVIRIEDSKGNLVVEFRPGEPEYEALKARCPAGVPLHVFAHREIKRTVNEKIDQLNKIN